MADTLLPGLYTVLDSNLTSQTNLLNVSTDQADYAPGETVIITASGFEAGSTVEFKISDDSTDPGDDGNADVYDPILVTDGVTTYDENGVAIGGDLDSVIDGNITTTWTVPTLDSEGGLYPDALNSTLNLTATGTGADGLFNTPDDQVATTTFTDAQLAVWAWRNQPSPTLNKWDAGTTIQSANSIYAEGEVIPFRWTSIAGGGSTPNLVENQTYTIQLDWAYAGGTTSPQKLFFDYLTSYNATESASVPFGSGSDLANFQSGIVSTVAIPNDPGDIPSNQPTVAHAPGVFTLFNINPATVTFSPYIVDPFNAQQEDRRLNITFTVADDGDSNHSEAMNVGVAWGAHLATQNDYGFQNGAASFPGAVPQMVVDFDPLTSGGLSNVNINPNAIVAQGQITITKDALPNSLQNFSFTITGPNGFSQSFTLDDDSGVVGADNTYSHQTTLFGLAEGTYTITENIVSGWTLSGVNATENGVEDTTSGDIFSTNLGTRTATITVANGEIWAVNFTNTVQNPNFTITKTASSITNPDNTNGGTTVNQAGDIINYTITVDNTGDQALTGVVVTDKVESYSTQTLTLVSGDTANPGVLDTNEIWTYNASYTVTQADLDNNGGGDRDIDNTATADTNETTSKSDSVNVPVDQQPNFTLDKKVGSILNLNGTTDSDGKVDQVGDLINYTIEVENTGNVTLTGITVNDPLLGGNLTSYTGDSDGDGRLDVTETWTYSGSYSVTQADLDNNGGGDGDIDNTATADTNETISKSDSESVPIDQQPNFTLDKRVGSVVNPNGTADSDGKVDQVGDLINYTIEVENTGNVTLTGVTVNDPLLGGSLTSYTGDTDGDGKLDVTETWTYSGSYSVTQADLDKGGNIVNTATADTTQTNPQSDSESVPVDQQPNFTLDKRVGSVVNPNGTVDSDGKVDQVGDLINYTIEVENTGNVTLTGITVTDPLLGGSLTSYTGDTDGDGKLDVTETWTYSGSYSVTQADLDNNGGGDGDIDNTATADTTQTTPQSDSESVPVDQKFALGIDKKAIVPGGTADIVGEVINYTIDVTNAGNAAVSNVVVNDPRLSSNPLTLISGDTDNDNKLDVGEIWKYNGSYNVTQADLDKGGTIDNTATAQGTGTTLVQDTEKVPVEQKPAININKVTVYGEQIGDGLSGVIAGTSIGWKYTVTNPGNVSLSNVSVKDNNGTSASTADDFTASSTLSGGFNVGDTNKDGKLNPGESWTFTASGTAVAGSYSNNGTASGTVGSTTVTKSDPSSYFGTADVGQIAPTGVSPNQYINGTAPDFSQFYASQGGAVQYGTSKGKINQTNPGVFFYYTGLSNTIKGFDGPDAGTAPDPLAIVIDQNNNGPNVNTQFGNTEWNFSATLNDVKLYKVTDANKNGKIDAGETPTQVQLQSSQVVFGSGANKGDITINFTPDAVGSLYVVGVKYDTGSVVGLPEGTRPTVKYTFNTDVGGNGTIEETDTKGITLKYKAPLTLDGDATVGGAVLTQAELAPVVSAAIDYWAAQGINAQSLNQLKQTDVLIGNLSGTSLGETVGEADGLIVKIDDDAAGYGWSKSLDMVNPNQVDLFSTLTHEFGHILGFDHDDMGEALGVGERHLPLEHDDLNLLKQQYSNVFAIQTPSLSGVC